MTTLPTAIVRRVSPSISRCELTYVDRLEISIERAREQHDRYVRTLAALGYAIEWLPDLADNPDAVFVEDTALVLDEIAVILRPGAESRRSETGSTAHALASHRTLAYLPSPGTLDGGDVLRRGRTLFVGMSARSNESGIRALMELVRPFGMTVVPVELRGCLHLKSAATFAGEDLLVYNPEWVDPQVFGCLHPLAVHPNEPHAANVLPAGDRVLVGAAFPSTAEALRQRGVPVETIDVSELAKAEGALTCCSLLVQIAN